LDKDFNRQRSIAKHIIDGTIAIDSVDELKSMLTIFPTNPLLHAAYADLAFNQKAYDKAASSFAHAAELYVNAGMLLPGILCKLLHWRLQKPSQQQARQFFADLQNAEFTSSPVNDFLIGLTYPELIAVTNRVARLRIPAGKIIKKIGDPEDALYLLSSGTIKETTYIPLRPGETTQPKSSVYLSENDVFGNVYPFEEELRSQSFAECITAVEIAKITRKRLIEICRKHPNIARAMMNLFNSQAKIVKGRASRGVRRVDRHNLPIRMDVDIFTNGHSRPAIKVHGFSRDISVGGVCFVVESESSDSIDDIAAIKEADVKVWLPGKSLTLSVVGKVVWCSRLDQKNAKSIAIGIQFKEMTPKMGGMLVVFADVLFEGE